MMETVSVIVIAGLSGFCAAGLVGLVFVRRFRKRESRFHARMAALEQRLQKLETEEQRAFVSAGKGREAEAHARKNLVAIVKGLTVSTLRLDRRLKAIERKTS
jgi:hypothetical protein